MKISETWLREHVSPPGGTAELVHQLTMQGLEVEGIEPGGPALPGIVAGRVIDVAPHPNADRLRVCQVDAGNGPVQIVCGAANVRAGGVYPVALPGAVLPGGAAIHQATLRGVESGGMLCSAGELGLGDAAGLLELGPETVPGTPAERVLGLPDAILDLKITPNRADCFSIIGVSRDLAATTGARFAEPEVHAVAPVEAPPFPVRVEDADGCPVFVVRPVRGIRAEAESPVWLKERLRRSGIRSIHPVVDITNLVMLEWGQPLHAYDLDRLATGLAVRPAKAGETLELLTGGAVNLDPGYLVIADGTGAIGLAGIMGGRATGVTAATVNVLLESAFFTPAAVAGRARRLGLQTDAATRFERGVDPAGQRRAIERATALLVAIAGGEAGPCQVTGSTPAGRPAILLRRERLARLLGAVIDDGEVEAILVRLGMRVVPVGGGWQVEPPSFRFDIAIEHDLIEEVARVHGYDRIAPLKGRQETTLGRAPAGEARLESLRTVLVQRGYHEAVTFSFVDGDLDRRLAGGTGGVPLVNPISAELAVMRQSLWPGLLQAVARNQARQQRRVRLFEAGIRFVPGPDGHSEEAVLAGIAAGSAWPEQWDGDSRPVDFHDVKADVEALLASVGPADVTWTAERHPALHPGRSARIFRAGRPAGWLGALHPSLVGPSGLDEAPVLFELDLAVVREARVAAYTPVSRYPAVRRDLAILVPRAIAVGKLVEAVTVAAGPVLREVVVFDIFAGENIDASEKSVALGLILQETSRTLTDAETDTIIGGVIQRLATDFSARIRE